MNTTAATLDAALSDTILDLKGLKCPLPALKARKALKGLPAGAVLTVICTDPMAAIDIPNLARETGDAVLDTIRGDGILTFRLQKGGAGL